MAPPKEVPKKTSEKTPAETLKEVSKKTPEKTSEKTPKELETAEAKSKTTTGLDLSAFLEEIKSRNFAIYKQLTQCQLKSQNETLHIYPVRKVTKTILARQNNADFLMSYLPNGTKLLIHEIDELEKAPELQQISAIMGNVQEVNNHDEGIPF